MNTFYNGKPVTKQNLLDMIRECIETGWKGSNLHTSTEKMLEKIYHGGYEGAEEDVQYILDKLNSKSPYGGYFYTKPNLQDVEKIISIGNWYFQE